MIKIIDYDAKWPAQFSHESKKLLAILNRHVNAIYHIGSTSIQGMSAKPIIDMIVEVLDFSKMIDIENKIIPLGYSKLRRSLIPKISAISQKITEGLCFNLHFFLINDPQIERHLNFRDFLTANHQWSKRYANLKKHLASEVCNDHDAYTRGKEQLIHAIDCRAKSTLGSKNTAKNVDLSSRLAATPDVIYESALLNHFLFLTHYSQYIQQFHCKREPGITLIDSELNSAEFNHITDIHYEPSQLEKKLSHELENIRRNKASLRIWDSFSPDKESMCRILKKMSINKISFSVFYAELKQVDIQEALDISIEQLLLPDDIKQYNLSNQVSEESVKHYFEMLSKVPLSKNDAVQFYRFMYKGQIKGYFTLVYYSGVVGMYWFDTLVQANCLRKLMQLLASNLLRQYSILTIVMPDGSHDYLQYGFTNCGQVAAFIV